MSGALGPAALVGLVALAAACGERDPAETAPAAAGRASERASERASASDPGKAQRSAPANAPASTRGGAAGSSAAPASEPPKGTGPWFVERTAEAGVDFVHRAGELPEKHLPETMGAGAALFDCDGDGDLDLYLVQGGPMRSGAGPGRFGPPPPQPGGGALPPNRLYLNDGSGRFEDATERSGAAAHTGYGMGVVAADFDGDGHQDLFVTNLGEDVLLLGDGAGAFRDATAAAGVGDGRWTVGAVAFDAEGDGDADLYVTAYLEVDLGEPLWCGDQRPGWRSVCHPDAYPGLADRFWRNRGDGTFEDATAACGLADNAGKGLGAVAFDVEGDGDPDLYVANDSVENRLWLNRGDGTFEDGTLLSGTGVNGRGATEAGMGLAHGDVDGDGDADLFVTNFDNESNTLYVNQGGGLFRDRTAAAGLEAASRLPVGFGTALADFDHDGDLDLVVANGHIIHNIHLYHDGKTHRQRAQGFANDGTGRFTELAPEELGALGSLELVGRGLYPGDLDGDGDLDLVLTECGGPARVFENRAAAGPGFTVPGLADGTRLELLATDGRRLVRTAGAPVSYCGVGGPAAHFGVGLDRVEALVITPPFAAARGLEARRLEAGELRLGPRHRLELPDGR